METQFSWFTLLLTAFYSLLASCRATDECTSDALSRCARPLEKMNNNALTSATTKEDLQHYCPKFQNSMMCIKSYTGKCLEKKQREHFNQLYEGANKLIIELCQDGSYQEEFLRHAGCVSKVHEYERCTKRYQKTTQEIERGFKNSSPTGPVKSICCALQDYLDCTHHTVRRQCGDDAAKFMKDLHNRMSSTLLAMHCTPFTQAECAAANGSSRMKIEVVLPVILIVLGRYFT
ncbi:uncharacterized protein [Prorops nasuta]|uniref:uncharacterized protein n=1 Tax=Prorops nasuta TaxID=863751 RepID=UPI0034CD758D